MDKYHAILEVCKGLYDYRGNQFVQPYEMDYDTLATIAELVENYESYKWHNLEENNFDLPRDYETVLCWTPRDGYMTMYRKGEWWRKTSDDEIYSTTRIATYVKGWRYIEGFEDE